MATARTTRGRVETGARPSKASPPKAAPSASIAKPKAQRRPLASPAAEPVGPDLAARCTLLGERVAMLEDAARGSQSVFGSSQHVWKRHPPLTADAMTRLEARLGCRLPEEARLWMSTVSAYGTGPAYGLLAPKLRGGSSPKKPFLASKKAGAGVFDGCVALADEGCGMTAVLVLEGKNRGQIWSIAQGGSRKRTAADFLSWMELWWSRATVEWCGSKLFDVLANGKVPPVAAAIEPMLEAALADTDRPTEEALITLCWLRCAAHRFDEATTLAERAADAFESPLTNRADPDDLREEDLERTARKHLYRARVFRLQGKAKEARAEAEKGLRIEEMWASTETELEAERDAKANPRAM